MPYSTRHERALLLRPQSVPKDTADLQSCRDLRPRRMTSTNTNTAATRTGICHESPSSADPGSWIAARLWHEPASSSPPMHRTGMNSARSPNDRSDARRNLTLMSTRPRRADSTLLAQRLVRAHYEVARPRRWVLRGGASSFGTGLSLGAPRRLCGDRHQLGRSRSARR